MNERIKELWNKVDLQEEDNPPSIVITSEREMQKFAELIVRECADMCTARKLTPAAFVASELREYFGVEQ